MESFEKKYFEELVLQRKETERQTEALTYLVAATERLVELNVRREEREERLLELREQEIQLLLAETKNKNQYSEEWLN